MMPSVDYEAIHQASAILDAGGLIAIPTETVYGLAANADDESAVLATYRVKGRPSNHPLIVHIADINGIDAWAQDVPEAAYQLARQYWPGPLTLVLKKKPRCGLWVTGGQDTVALRCPSHPWVQSLLREFEGPTHRGLTAPSANTFGRISPSSAQHVMDDLGVKPAGKLDMILDGGPCEFGIESTMINLSGDKPSLLRHGVVTRAMLEETLGCAVPDAGADAPRASGRLKSHYAPRTVLELVHATDLSARIMALRDSSLAIMAGHDTLSATPTNVKMLLAAPDNLKDYGATLYEHLHMLDAAGCDRILIELPPQDDAWAAINDRLGRAAA